MKILGHFQTSIMKALEEIEPNYLALPGLVICGTHAPKDLPLEDFLEEIRLARENRIPFLGICFGHQLAAIEYARNVLNIKNATSEEFGEGYAVVRKRPELKVGLHDGESYWSNYQVDLDSWEKPFHFLTVQYHPEYQSSAKNPHRVLVDFLRLCKSV